MVASIISSTTQGEVMDHESVLKKCTTEVNKFQDMGIELMRTLNERNVMHAVTLLEHFKQLKKRSNELEKSAESTRLKDRCKSVGTSYLQILFYLLETAVNNGRNKVAIPLFNQAVDVQLQRINSAIDKARVNLQRRREKSTQSNLTETNEALTNLKSRLLEIKSFQEKCGIEFNSAQEASIDKIRSALKAMKSEEPTS